MMQSKVFDLKKFGQSIWVDEIRREFLVNGELKRMIDEDGLTGMTTNPTIFEKAVIDSTLYDDEIKTLARQGKKTEEIYDALTWKDVRTVADELYPIYKKTSGFDGYVSVEVPAHLAYDSDASVEEALRIWKAIDRENILVKIPGTHVGTKAIRKLTARGVNINVTLLFSKRQYSAAACAYLDGLNDMRAKGEDLSKVFSVASIFVSRIDTAVDKEIDRLIDDESDPQKKEDLKSLRGKAAVGNTKLVYQRFKELWEQERFKELAENGAKVQWMVWGSTSTKDPSFNDLKYVENLVGPQTINTIPKKTIDAFRDHGTARETIEEGLEEAKRDLAKIEAAGIDLGEIFERLQKEGIEAFDASYKNLLKVIETKKQALVAS